MSHLLESLAAHVVVENPRRIAERTVEFIAVTQGLSAALAAVLNEGRIEPFAGWGEVSGLLAAAESTWRSSPGELASGATVIGREHAVAGLCNSGDVVGLLVVRPPRLSEEHLAAARMMLLPAVQAWHGFALSFVEQTSTEAFLHDKLLNILVRNEWNIARVARLLKVTRRTIYVRMEKYGILREKVPKTLRPRRPIP